MNPGWLAIAWSAWFALSGGDLPVPARPPPDASRAAAPSVRWADSYAEGIAAAKQAGKPVLLDFSAAWCGWCRVMDREVYTDPRIVKLSERFVCVKVDVDHDPKTALAYQISSLPRTIVLDPQGATAADLLGYVEADRFYEFLTGASTNAPGAAAADVTSEPEIKDPARLIERLGHADAKVRARASTRLVALGDEALPALVHALSSDYLGTRLAAYAALRRLTKVDLEFDPWAEKPARQTAARQWEEWLKARPGPAGAPKVP